MSLIFLGFGKREDTLEIKPEPTFLVKIGGVLGWFAIPAGHGLMQPLANPCTEPFHCSSKKPSRNSDLSILFIR